MPRSHDAAGRMIWRGREFCDALPTDTPALRTMVPLVQMLRQTSSSRSFWRQDHALGQVDNISSVLSAQFPNVGVAVGASCGMRLLRRAGAAVASPLGWQRESGRLSPKVAAPGCAHDSAIATSRATHNREFVSRMVTRAFGKLADFSRMISLHGVSCTT